MGVIVNTYYNVCVTCCSASVAGGNSSSIWHICIVLHCCINHLSDWLLQVSNYELTV